MKLIIIHGNALVSISSKITALKSKFDSLSIEQLSGKDKEWDHVAICALTPGLFAEERLLILEDFDERVDLEKLPQNDDMTILFVFRKPLAATSQLLKQSASLHAEVISLSEKDETSIFPFLDLVAEKNPKALQELDDLISEYGGQYLLTMLFYLLRRSILPSKNLSSYMAGKIEKQKKNFPKERIEILYQTGLELDYKVKSGNLDEKMALTLFLNAFFVI